MYQSHLRKKFDIKEFNPIVNTYMNKPRGGLWGCRNNEWKTWCKNNNFPCGKHKTHWEFTGNILYINNKQDFINVWNKYHIKDPKYKSIEFLDFEKISKDYDALEVSQEAVWETRFMDDNMGLYSWDVASIVVFNIEKVKVKPFLNSLIKI